MQGFVVKRIGKIEVGSMVGIEERRKPLNIK